MSIELGVLLQRLENAVNKYAADQQAAVKRAATERLKDSLECAIEVEFATIPLYLSSLWSIKDPLNVVAVSLRNIVQEEMLHLSLACNMLVAVGGEPGLAGRVPTYPGKLPLGVHPELTLKLGGLTRAAVKNFIEIERPDQVRPDSVTAKRGGKQAAARASPEPDRTIGDMYAEILRSFDVLAPELSHDEQLSGPLAWMVMRNLYDVREAVTLIRRQGEGDPNGPTARNRRELSHFDRFREIRELKEWTQVGSPATWELLEPIQFNYDTDVWPVGPVPRRGYPGPLDPQVADLLLRFDAAFSEVVDLLDVAWTARPWVGPPYDGEEGQALLIRAFERMFSLEGMARPLMSMPRPDKPDTTYCPRFTYLARADHPSGNGNRP